MGEGAPLISMPQPLISSLDGYVDVPEAAAWYETLARGRQLVRFDHRGCTLARGETNDFSLPAMIRDVEAVVYAIGAEQVDLLAEYDSGPIAITYTVAHPERVRRLVTWSSWARSKDIMQKETFEALEKLVTANLLLFHESIMLSLSGSYASEASRFARAGLDGAPAAKIAEFLAAAWDYDVTDKLPTLDLPVLVLHRRDDRMFDRALATRLASSLPQAELNTLPGDASLPWLGDTAAVVSAINEFLGTAPSTLNAPQVSALRTVLFTDLVGHTEMMRRLGDERGRAVLREHESMTRELLRSHGGTEVKTMGDGFMASFGSVTRAVECAVALQKAFDERNKGEKGTRDREIEPLLVRVGLNAGEPIEEDGDLFGSTVIMASRIAAKAEGGEILVADTVRGLCSGKGFLFADRGEFVAKGFEEPVRVYEVGWRS
jgi:class 3 adenylate cyclase